MGTMTKKKDDKISGLDDVVFSWSLADVMNKAIYKDKVKTIPETFSSTKQYFESLICPLIEETHADLQSNMTNVSHAPTCEIYGVKKIIKDPKRLQYQLLLKPGAYKPEGGDLIALTEVKPKRIDDLDRPNRPYCVALVQGAKLHEMKIKIVSSKHIITFENEDELKNGIAGDKLFAVHLTNLTTNIRIWNALHPDIKGGNMKIINSVLGCIPHVEQECTLCSSNETESDNISKSREAINPLGLDDSQKAAVLSVISTSECHHENSVKLIWGPPGTGKTKTIAALAFALFRIKCRTLTCAPTNVAVVGVTKRLMSLLSGKTYGLGDIVLFGNGERMKIDDQEDLSDVFLEYRVCVLSHCFAPKTGWAGSLESMICLLEDPQCQYLQYMGRMKGGNEEDSDEDDVKEGNDNENEICREEIHKGNGREFWKDLITRDLKENKKKKTKMPSGSKSQSKCHEKGENVIFWTFEEFLIKSFRNIGQKLMHCIIGLCTHMPTKCLPLEVAERMIKAHEMIQVLVSLMSKFDASGKGLKDAIEGKNENTGSKGGASNLRQMRLQFLGILRLLRGTFSVPDFYDKYRIGIFCLQNASLIFCTASSSAKLNTESMTKIELLIIDEAAQLKECESCIPLQIPGLRNAILVGDELQLPAMVQSKICERADFGRSLFGRLVILGHNKHLLNVQYRMHPSISLFPNREFYSNGIKNGENVKEKVYERRFLKGEIFDSYSFIDINNGKEEFDDRFSLKNMVEASAVADIVSQLYKECALSKKKVRVGCISPYKAQVSAIKERLGNTYSTDFNDTFSVNVRSVDGFQGGEEDIIIISTVRCNGKGSVGFLSNFQRVNVALTRARYCCWILGNAATLLNSGSVWKKLVLDAKSRDCFHNADENKSLALAITNALVMSGQLNSLLCMDSVLFKMSKWKVCFSAQFHESMIRLDSQIIETVKTLLVKLSNGWREEVKDGSTGNLDGATSKLLECYDVKGHLKLIWSVEILRESSEDTQVLKIWDIVPIIGIPKVAKTLDVRFGRYTWNYISLCLCKRIEGDLALPMTWPVDGKPTSSNSNNKDASHDLARKLAATTLSDHAPRSNNLYNRSRPSRWRGRGRKYA